jgi:hypothetical protein
MINLAELLDKAKKKALEKPDTTDGYAPKSTDELRFKKKHVVQKTDDRNGNKDDVFKATNVKTVLRAKERHGHDVGDDEKVYEEVSKVEKPLNRLKNYKVKDPSVKPLVGNQTKLDKNHNGKIDAEDFKKLRKEEIHIDEVLTPSMGAGAYISDFVGSKNPKFAGKSKKERMKQALAAYLSAKRGE